MQRQNTGQCKFSLQAKGYGTDFATGCDAMKQHNGGLSIRHKPFANLM